jgi:hypothetical protein
MSQYGAYSMVPKNHGYTYDQILNLYYTGISLKTGTAILMKISDFYFDLPEALIAQDPLVECGTTPGSLPGQGHGGDGTGIFSTCRSCSWQETA